MIILENLSKKYKTRAGDITVLNKVNLSIRQGEKVGILGKNGAGKSTIIRMISGAEKPTSGTIIRNMTVSWPLAFGGAFQGTLTGLDNLHFICRVYGTDPYDKLEFIEEFTELGRYLREPLKTYSAGMRARLAFAISMVVEFDCFLIDEIIAVGDSRFHEKCNFELFQKRKERAMIIVSHDKNYIQSHCDRAAVLKSGELTNFESVDDAFEFYDNNT